MGSEAVKSAALPPIPPSRSLCFVRFVIIPAFDYNLNTSPSAEDEFNRMPVSSRRDPGINISRVVRVTKVCDLPPLHVPNVKASSPFEVPAAL